MSNKEGKDGGLVIDLGKITSNIRDSVSRIVEDTVSAFGGTQLLPVDIYETETAIIIVAGPLSGIDPEAIDVSVVGEMLIIKGETKFDLSEIPEENFLKRERRFGQFARSIKLTRPVKADQADAEFKDNLLKISLPKVEQPEPKVINIRSVDV